MKAESLWAAEVPSALQRDQKQFDVVKRNIIIREPRDIVRPRIGRRRHVANAIPFGQCENGIGSLNVTFSLLACVFSPGLTISGFSASYLASSAPTVDGLFQFVQHPHNYVETRRLTKNHRRHGPIVSL